MKSYYHAHESAYKIIKEKGHVGWGNIKTLEELNSSETHDFLKQSIYKWSKNPNGKYALDLGCGTGTTAFTLSQLGFNVTGIDISETAIELANELAKAQKLNIRFKVYDLLLLNQLEEKFDIVYDSHCLHCIVFEDDRKLVLDGVKKILNTDGIFILDTMVLGVDTVATGGTDTLRFDNDHILWHKTNSNNYLGIIEIDGQKWCAQRRIYPPTKVMEEIIEAGFKVLSESLDKQKATDPWMLRLVLSI
ncbi:MAG: class I SAM-dependent methyltransferase [Bacteriovorax sp.]|nr:class I SAM-dependent methyltransferase [Bacteriovorax sp.]